VRNLIPVLAREVVLEEITLGSKMFGVQQEFIATQARLGYPSFADKPVSSVEPKPDQLHSLVPAPRSEGHIWDGLNLGRSRNDSGQLERISGFTNCNALAAFVG
jgi:hypothetical protein